MSQQPTFVDIHSHFLYGVDDGAPDMERSMVMLKQAAEENIAVIAATPHATDMVNDALSEKFLNHFAKLQNQVQRAKLQIDLVLASELFFGEHIYEWLQYPWATFNNNKKYLLFELPLFDMPRKVGDFIFQCKLNGITPILAHPERYKYLHKKEETLLAWHRQGCLFQINAGSVYRQFGQPVATFARKLLKAHLAHFVASDAHDHEFRNFKGLKQAWESAKEYLPSWYLDQLFYENPKRALAGQIIQPPPVDEHELLGKWRRVFRRLTKQTS